ncbi:STAS domain-containing protein [Planosporangium sp. 12N6]|uniref:STAS domain-containing protein n=1 Tax=Planosporangium spinosum TaxID=3402278 RepID=UPI003CEE2CA1
METAGHEIGPAPLELGRSSDGPGRVCLAVTGELDISNLDRLRDAFTAILAQPQTVALVVDFGQLEFIDSSGVQVLMRARQDADRRGTVFRVVNAHGKVLRVLTILGVHEILSATDERLC